LGGVLCDTLGWRWCFYAQVPPTFVGLLLILWKLPDKPTKSSNDPEGDSTFKQKFQRVDVLGALTLMITIISFLLTLEFFNQDVPPIYSLFPGLTCLISALLFAHLETHTTKEPILPLSLLTNRDTLTAYLLAAFQMAAQFSLYYSIPIYFQIVTQSSVSEAGVRLSPAVIGNATAGLIAGYTISKIGRYKTFTILGNLVGWASNLLILVRWRGHTHPAETLYLVPGGFASGVTQSTTFIHLAAVLDQSQMAVAGTTLYLVHNLALLVGLQLSTAVLHVRLRSGLDVGLDGVKDKKNVSSSHARLSWMSYLAR
jgi:predicted MFS family arabinose efflux permease